MDYIAQIKDLAKKAAAAAIEAAAAAKKAAEEALEAAAEKLKSTIFPIKLSNDTLNKAVGKVFGEEKEIQSVTLAVHDGWFEAQAKIKHGLAAFDVTVEFEILRFEVDQQVQLIELRQRNELKTDALGWRNKIAVYVVKSIISAFTGKSLLHWGLKGKDGITVNKDLISIDLATAGAKEALFAAMEEKIGQGGSFLNSLIQGSTEKLADCISIKDAKCTDGAMVVNVAWISS